ncbi:PilZ domain-containing protein [Aurantiacibacter poecillastricola]|uniref:PilZ domain-containing protein n=1 Tax=Aurantiacibacter poecillastricola TaxID=3064385 RepID=UPI00273DBAD2|nr:PilZ domain-containing protein [Aurantiacibacter sp. 219JJ12-13]MDP5260661.1 PilZ domain-containing protein [Aurantiacibacter sp. 219JJ12-13]
MGEVLRQQETCAGRNPGDSTIENRSAPRCTLLIRAAKLITPSGEFLCVIRDVSTNGINVRIFHALPPETRMTIELQNGDRHEVEFVWQKDDRAGFRFEHEADISRIVESPSRFSKRSIRLNISAAATVSALNGQSALAEITDLSQQGAKIVCAGRFAIDERVRISAPGLPETNAKVRWRKELQYGLIFEDTYQYGELARIAQRLQQRDEDIPLPPATAC